MQKRKQSIKSQQIYPKNPVPVDANNVDILTMIDSAIDLISIDCFYSDQKDVLILFNILKPVYVRNKTSTRNIQMIALTTELTGRKRLFMLISMTFNICY